MNAVGQSTAREDETRPEAPKVPPEIAFLTDHGCRAADLAWAAAMAARTRVPPDEWMIKEGVVSEAAFYRALAAHAGLPFVERPELGWFTAFPRCIEKGVAPLAEPQRYVIAPEGVQISRLLEMSDGLRSALSITTPSIFRAAVLEHCGPAVAEKAAEELRRRRPAYAFPRESLPRSLAGAAAAVALAAAGALIAPREMLLATASLLSLPFLGMVLLRILAVGHAAPVDVPAPRRVHESVLPAYTIIVALHREARVVPKLVAALKNLDYPAAKLDIKLVIERDDRETAEALARAAVPACMEIVVAPPGWPRTKPRALNVALPLARGAFTVVYDAEDEPDPQQLRRAVSRFRELPDEIVCLQARLAIREPHNWLTRLFAIEYAALFDVINPGLIAFRVPLPLGGTSNHFRTAALRDLVGWDAWNVTEDADLGIRLARLGYAVRDLPSSTYEEAPPSLDQWIRQRARWMKAFMQTCITHTRQPATVLRQLGPAVTMTYGTVLSALGYPLFTAAFLIGLSDGSLLAAEEPLHLAWTATSVVLFGSGLAAMILPALVGIARRRWWPLLAYVPLLPFYYLLISIGAWRGLVELVFKTYHWNKTEHGLRLIQPSKPVPGGA